MSSCAVEARDLAAARTWSANDKRSGQAGVLVAGRIERVVAGPDRHERDRDRPLIIELDRRRGAVELDLEVVDHELVDPRIPEQVRSNDAELLESIAGDV